jgi:N4-bis(aminopropyl)spermidine synthase
MFYLTLQEHIVNSPNEYDLLARITQHPDRPRPIREIDQIFMLPGSQLNQAKLISGYTAHKDVVFLGDGDCMAASLGLLAKEGIIEGPSHMLVLDFDERITEFALAAARQFGFQDRLDAEQYNILEPVPEELRFRHDIFYTNPPYGSKNKGASGVSFLSRCMALCKPVGSAGVAILPYHPSERWSRDAMRSIQQFMTAHGYIVSEMLRAMHSYHLDDLPMLRSATVIFDRVSQVATPNLSTALGSDMTKFFYGSADMPIPRGISKNGNLLYEDGADPGVGDTM